MSANLFICLYQAALLETRPVLGALLLRPLTQVYPIDITADSSGSGMAANELHCQSVESIRF